MLSGHTLTKTVRQWGLVIAMGVAGFAAGIAVFILIGRDGIVHALNAAPAIVVGLASRCCYRLPSWQSAPWSPSRRSAGATCWRELRSTT